jgi:hypothetical protein
VPSELKFEHYAPTHVAVTAERFKLGGSRGGYAFGMKRYHVTTWFVKCRIF